MNTSAAANDRVLVHAGGNSLQVTPIAGSRRKVV